MKANELRYGNNILCKGEIIKVTMIGEYGIQSKTFDRCINAKFSTPDLEPIPLTEEWLLKFGFEKVITKYTIIEGAHYQNKDCWIYLIDDGFELELNVSKERFNLYRVYKYVHQLQNLYFALTQKELTK